MKIERLGFASAAATAHIVSTLDEFRSLFAKDLLKRGTPLKVARAAILFSDLTGSTALYTKVGDAAAFRLVDDHFDVLRAVVAAHEGVLVKTMGDAVMAAFVDASQCARAATDALARFEAFRAGRRTERSSGSSSGSTRAPATSSRRTARSTTSGRPSTSRRASSTWPPPGELVIPSDTYAALDAAEQASLAVVERFEAHVKGVEHPLALVRARLAK